LYKLSGDSFGAGCSRIGVIKRDWHVSSDAAGVGKLQSPLGCVPQSYRGSIALNVDTRGLKVFSEILDKGTVGVVAGVSWTEAIHPNILAPNFVRRRKKVGLESRSIFRRKRQRPGVSRAN
jgi:hypothetical protein